MFKFKNLFFSLLFVFVLFQVSSVFSIGNVVSAQDEVTYGDVNGDENINSIDFALMRQHILGVVKEFDNGIEAADVDGNGEFNSLDFAFMRKYLLGFINDFPANENPTPTPTAISEYEDGVIDVVTVLEEDKVYRNLSVKEGASLDLNGYDVAVVGDFLQSGDVNINSGTLKVEGDYIIEDNGILQMIDEEDYVFVGGDFINSSEYINTSSAEMRFSAGTLEVRGNFKVDSDKENFRATGSHKVVLSGVEKQLVVGYTDFNELEIKNEKGVEFTSEIGINKMKGRYKVIGELALMYVESIEGDVIIEGDFRLIGGLMDLSGHSFCVEGNFVQGNFVQGLDSPSTKVSINGGKLLINGDYSINFNENEAILQMTNEEDYLYVGGDFSRQNGNTNNEKIMAGTLEVKGDFSCIGFRAEGSHKVVLSGEVEQLVVGYPDFNELEIKNEKGVEFTSEIGINKMKGRYKVIGELALMYVESIEGDVIIEGDFRLIGGLMDLSGHSFCVEGNFVQGNFVQGLDSPSTKVSINGGKLLINGDYSINFNENEAILQMTNEEDYVYVGGDFSRQNGNTNNEKIMAGTLEVKGDFSCAGFRAEGNHKVLLSGDEKQLVVGYTKFNELEIKNEKGVEFTSEIAINRMKGRYKVIGELVLMYVESIEGDVIIEGDFRLIGGVLDLSGHGFCVEGSFVQGFDYPATKVNINGGHLLINGDYSMNSSEHEAILQMTNEEDYVYVSGDFITYSGSGNFNEEDNNLTAGVMEVKGDFKCERDDDRFGRYVASGSHKVVLSGNEEQLVSNKSGWLVFNKLEITNEKGVRFDNITPINIVKGKYKVLDEAMLIIGTIDGNVLIDGDLTIMDQEIDLNGYELKINGNLEQFSSGIISGNDCCKIKINGGSLLVAGDYRIGYDTIEDQIESYGNGSVLEMTNEDDYVFVGGDFITASRYCYYDYKHEDENRIEYLSAGILEVKGNFDSMGFANFVATGGHKLLLSGSRVQVINNTFIENGEISNSCVDINELEIRNEKGVEINSEIGIRKLKGNYKVIGELKLICLESPILGDVTIDGDLTIMGGLLDLDGHELNVTGNLTQDYVQPNTVKINGGRLNVYGDYTIEGELGREYSILEMTNEDDYVFVGGDFTTASTYCYYGYDYDYEYKNGTVYLSAGVLEVKGNFYSISNANFVATGSHKLVLSGSSVQTINNTFVYNGEILNSCVEINELEIRNEKGVEINSEIVIRKLKGNYKVIGGLELSCVDSLIMEDVTIDSDLTIVGGLLDLNGHELKVTGNLTQDFYMTNHIKINSGKLIVSGDYIIQSNKYSEIVATLQMTNEEDYVHVGGNFTTNSNADHSEYLTAGTFEVKGDFTQSGYPMSFAASETHKTILSGDDIQTIIFEQLETSFFNILKLTKPIDTGYIFNTTPVWKTLDETIGNE